MTQQFSQHEMNGRALPDDSRRILPLIGNDEIKLCVDARGVMHDFTVPDDVWSGHSHPTPRIVWSGRRHTRRPDALNSNPFEWGFLNMSLTDEDTLPAVTGWRQRLVPREGRVKSEIERGDTSEFADSFVHLDKNVVVFHRQYKDLPEGVRPRVRAVYTFCREKVDEVPFHMEWKPGAPFAQGIAADTCAHGLRTYRGRIALLADQPAEARAVDNRLELECPLAEDGSVTVFLTFADDLGNDRQLPPIPEGDWIHPVSREVLHEINTTPIDKPDPTDASEKLQHWIGDQGYARLRQSHIQSWQTFWDQLDIQLPREEETIRASLETQAYTLRCTWTQWSMPPTPFNSAWGASYFWDERFGFEGLLNSGVDELPRRVVEWRRSILPYAVQMTSGRGARYPWCVTENGAALGDHSKTHHFSYAHLGVIANYTYTYCQRHDDPELWRRHYPILREIAEFYRWWLLIELPGNLVMLTPTCDINEGDFPQQDGPFTFSGAVRVFSIAREVAAKLGIDDPGLERWAELQEKTLATIYALYPQRETPDGYTAPSIAGFVDYDLHLLPKPELPVDPTLAEERLKLREKARPPERAKILEHGGKRLGKKQSTMPWGRFMGAFGAATRHEPDQAVKMLEEGTGLLREFQCMAETVRLDSDGLAHPWFATAAGAYLRAVSRMLVYPCNEDICIAFGVPEKWRDLSYKLPVNHGGRAEVKIEDGQLTKLVLHELGSGKREREIRIPSRLLPERPQFADSVQNERYEGELTVIQVHSRGETVVVDTAG